RRSRPRRRPGRAAAALHRGRHAAAVPPACGQAPSGDLDGGPSDPQRKRKGRKAL
ncbi:unnamed protein product, partial [Prorocentrum cordatum]